MGMSDLVNRLEGGAPLERDTVVFTVDDGYADFAAVASPIFAAYDCPVTVFLVTDFVAGRIWNWYDRVEWCFEESPRTIVQLDLPNERFVARWTNDGERIAASCKLVEALKRVPDGVKEDRILALAEATGVGIPVEAPLRYRAMSWEDVRTCGKRGATFGPHTLTHPVLSRVDESRAAREISESWKAVSDGTESTVPVFCYPNGTAADFSPRDEALVARAGMRAAVSAIEGSIASTRSRLAKVNPFSLPRYPYSENRERFVQIASGVEQLKNRLRRGLRRGPGSPH
jgi:peptidoglycan/xylan/chitin deacetylase (PgdA/CDA1 family)